MSQMECNCKQECCDYIHGCNDTTIERNVHVVCFCFTFRDTVLLNNINILWVLLANSVKHLSMFSFRTMHD